MKAIIINQWENEHYPLGTIKKQKLSEKTEHEIIFILNRMAQMPAIVRFGEASEV
ncbi:hypothetical protein RU89_GL002334 [Lactococcus cremoris]|uniref:Uncharacterized protein n=2 Tax=Lactococcus lactis subsp. cremoris TaxID=1359 RepID=A0A1V0PHI1_LACLC|nr:hypothetical protein [Lactococcus cremoris]EUN35247.1 phage-related protein [Lactococcus cremoris subsp. cremoris HP]ARE28432.1 hypothetical protein LLJM1_1057 [Lactococcus cremoris]KZK13447.1 Phage protein [Lactococcus cremoris]KZK41854.1 Phage protein [Lactococcus cremoris]MCT4464981.1 hypothetical protein [Lactococcus cremoris]